MIAQVGEVKTALYRRAKRLIAKCDKIGYEFSDIELGVFSTLGREEWQEDKINWLVLEQFGRLYAKFYP